MNEQTACCENPFLLRKRLGCAKKDILENWKRSRCQMLTYALFLISNPHRVEMKVLLGFDLESSEVRGGVFPQSDPVAVSAGLREA